MDDEDSKPRRNLMALSFGILAFDFLRLSVPDGHNGFSLPLGLTLPPRHQGKLWILIGVLLLYVVWRYTHSKDASELRSRYATRFGNYFRATLQREINRKIVLPVDDFATCVYLQAGAVKDAMSRVLGNLDQNDSLISVLCQDLNFDPHAKHTGQTGILTLRITVLQQGQVQYGDQAVPFLMPQSQLFRAKIIACVHMAWRTGIVPDLLLPYFLSSCALIGVVFHL
jgi:hypothetical protein